MPKILVCSLGGQPAPVVNAIGQNRADHVFLLCSKDDPEAEARGSEAVVDRETTRSMEGHCSRCDKKFKRIVKVPPLAKSAGLSPGGYDVEIIDDPDDLPQVVEACERIRGQIRERWPNSGTGAEGGADAGVGAGAGVGAEVIANYTGGTKTMSFGLGLVGFRAGWTLQVNRTRERRVDLVRITVGDVALPQDTSQLLVSDTSTKVEELMARGDFEGAMVLLNAVVSARWLPPGARDQLLRLESESRMRAAWDRFDLDGALEIARGDSALKEHVKSLKVILRARHLLASDEPWREEDVSGLELVEDLLENARRTAGRQRYDDAVGRLYRTTELLAQVRLRRRYGLTTHDIDLGSEHLNEVARERLTLPVAQPEDSGAAAPIQIGLVASYELLGDMEDALGRYYCDRRERLRGLIKRRNRSLFAHGMTPIDRTVWNEVGDRWLEWLDGALDVCCRELG